MPLLFDPLYAIKVKYLVSKSIWDLYEINYWQLLVRQSGKNKAFPILRQRYEKDHYEVKALIFLVYVFAITYLIEWFAEQREPFVRLMAAVRGIPQNNVVGDNNNPDQPNDANNAPNGGSAPNTGNQ